MNSRQIARRLSEKIERKVSIANKKTAALGHGPFGRAVLPYWNKIHDLEYDLEKAISEYDEVASYSGKAQKDAWNMISEISKLIKHLEDASMRLMPRLAKLEDKFTRVWGKAEDYVEERRERMFSD